MPEDSAESGTRTVQRSEPTGRSAQFYAPVEAEPDIEAIAQRVAQFVAVGWQRGELDAVQVTMREAKNDDGQ